jgi:hypothetical protein
VEDDHVDRPGVEAQQCVQLTGTNRSIGLNALISRCPFAPAHVSVPVLLGTAATGDHKNQRAIIKTHAAKSGVEPVCLYPPFAGLVTFAE